MGRKKEIIDTRSVFETHEIECTVNLRPRIENRAEMWGVLLAGNTILCKHAGPGTYQSIFEEETDFELCSAMGHDGGVTINVLTREGKQVRVKQVSRYPLPGFSYKIC